MARNIYFSEKVRSEQALYEDIVVEALKIYGYDMYYLPRDVMKRDDLLNEDPSSRFNSSYMIEMYVDNVDGFDGQGDLFQKFGVEIRDAVTLTMSRRRWTQAIKRYDNELTTDRPLEGDLIYVPFSRKLFQIMKVEHEAPFYQLTNLPTYKLQCELFEYSGDDFDTGVQVIDQIERSYAYKYILSFTSGINATATATLDSQDRVGLFVITAGGVGYTSPPDVTITTPTQLPRTGAVTLRTDNNEITAIDIVDSGNYYLLPPTFTIPSPTPEFAKFGDRSLKLDLDSGSNRFVLDLALYPIGETSISSLNNRLVYKGFLWLESTGEQYDNIIYIESNVLIYHRASDHKLVVDDGVVQVASNRPLVIYDSDLDSGMWNYFDIHFLNNQVKININGDSGEPTLLNDVLALSPFVRTVAGQPDSDQTINPDITSGFKGYMDTFAHIASLDTEFRLSNPVPTNSEQMRRDEDTLKLASVFTTFDHIPPEIQLNISSGRITGGNILHVGSGMRDSSYVLNISSPEGVATDFVAQGRAVLTNGVVTSIEFVNGGSGYTTVPTIKITPQGANVTFDPGDVIYQTLANGTIISADVTQFSDSDYRLHVVNLSSSDGTYTEFQPNLPVYRDSAGGVVSAIVISVEEQSQSSEIEQNNLYSTEATTFLDFSETNPFGDPENN
jgi:hypothetical protein